MKKLLFVFDHPNEDLWMDGLYKALIELEKDFEIVRLNLQKADNTVEIEVMDFDFILGWGGFNSKVDHWMMAHMQHPAKKGLCIGGNSFAPHSANSYDILFCETNYIKDVYLRGIVAKKVKAFGVNTDIYFTSDMPSPMVWDYLGVGSFSWWKRWDKMIGKKGSRLVVGEYQKGNEQESLLIIRDLVYNGVMVSPMVSPFDLSNIYQWSRTVYIPADINGGGERAIWEAKACGCRVEVESDNPKLQELVHEEVLDHKAYAKSLKDGIYSML